MAQVGAACGQAAEEEEDDDGDGDAGTQEDGAAEAQVQAGVVLLVVLAKVGGEPAGRVQES